MSDRPSPGATVTAPYALHRACARPMSVSSPWKLSKVARRAGHSTSAWRRPRSPAAASAPTTARAAARRRPARQRPRARGSPRKRRRRWPTTGSRIGIRSGVRPRRRDRREKRRGGGGQQKAGELRARPGERPRESHRDRNADEAEARGALEVVPALRIGEKPRGQQRIGRRAEGRERRSLVGDLPRDAVPGGAAEVGDPPALAQQKERRRDERQSGREGGQPQDEHPPGRRPLRGPCREGREPRGRRPRREVEVGAEPDCRPRRRRREGPSAAPRGDDPQRGEVAQRHEHDRLEAGQRQNRVPAQPREREDGERAAAFRQERPREETGRRERKDAGDQRRQAQAEDRGAGGAKARAQISRYATPITSCGVRAAVRNRTHRVGEVGRAARQRERDGHEVDLVLEKRNRQRRDPGRARGGAGEERGGGEDPSVARRNGSAASGAVARRVRLHAENRAPAAAPAAAAIAATASPSRRRGRAQAGSGSRSGPGRNPRSELTAATNAAAAPTRRAADAGAAGRARAKFTSGRRGRD